MKLLSFSTLLLSLPATLAAEPLLTSWYTAKSGQYARIYTNLADEAAQNAVTTWSGGAGVQSLPTYAGVSEVASTGTDVYIRTTNLGFHVMGPWFLDAAKTVGFGNFPANQAVIYRFPRTPSIPATKTGTQPGAIGYFVDGIAMFDSTDTFSYDTSAGSDQTPGGGGVVGDGVWNRDAYVNEGVTFDSANAHQAGSNHHYHANPPGLRHLLGDSVDHDPATNTYTENFNGAHSPIIGWCRDGLPIYGPYAYSDPLDPGSPVRRMISGYQKRDGSNGSTDLTLTGRTTLPDWVVRNNPSYATNVLAVSQHGPDVNDVVEFDMFSNVNETAGIGRYLEDYAYKGDLGLVQGVDFDLDEYNVRWCVTPQFPNGTWAYFTCIEGDGTPAFPYNISLYYFGSPTGSAESTVPGDATIHFEGGPDVTPALSVSSDDPSSGDVVLSWSGPEGGYHTVGRSGDLEAWESLEADVQPTDGIRSETVDAGRALGEGRQFYRVTLVSLDSFDSAGFNTDHVVTGGGSGEFTATFSAPAGAPSALPPQGAVTGVTIGGVTATITAYDQNGGIIDLTFDDSGLAPGSYPAVIAFNSPQGAATQASTNSYTVN